MTEAHPDLQLSRHPKLAHGHAKPLSLLRSLVWEGNAVKGSRASQGLRPFSCSQFFLSIKRKTERLRIISSEPTFLEGPKAAGIAGALLFI